MGSSFSEHASIRVLRQSFQCSVYTCMCAVARGGEQVLIGQGGVEGAGSSGPAREGCKA